MTKHSTCLSVLAAAVMLAPGAAAAQGQDNTSYGTSAAEFLLLAPTARGVALGGVYGAMSTELGGLNGNPGALALMRRPGASFARTSYVVDTDFSWGGIATPTGGGAGALGLQFGTYGFKDQPVTTPGQPETAQSYSVSQTFIAATMARNFSDKFSVGLTAKGVFDQLGDVSGSAYAIDFGTHYHSQVGGRPTRFAFTLSNLGTALSYHGQPLRKLLPRSVYPDSLPGDGNLPKLPIGVEMTSSAWALPVKFQVSAAHDFIATQNTRLTLGAEFNQMRSDKSSYGGAAEFATERVGGTPFGLAVRGSYAAKPSLDYTDGLGYVSDSKDKNAGLAAGFGVTYATRSGFSLGVDYAWKSLGLLGNANTVSISVGW